jgi:hypothetical protein
MTPSLDAAAIGEGNPASTTTSPGSMFGEEATEAVSGLGVEVLVGPSPMPAEALAKDSEL